MATGIGIGVLLAVVAVLAFIVTRPGGFRIERSAQISAPATCCSTKPLLITRPQSIAATRRSTFTLWSSPMLALATRPMCDPNADAPAIPMVLPGAPPSQPACRVAA